MPNTLQLAGLAALALLSMAQAGGREAPPAAPSSACVPGYVRPDLARMQTELTAARARWQAAGVRDYSYRFTRRASPVVFPAVRVDVRGGKLRGVTQLSPAPVPTLPLYAGPVETLFGEVARAIAYQRSQSCPVLRVAYDLRDGHPTRLSSGTGELNVADGDGEWTLTNFTRP